jgi:hypothetical protein
MYIVIMSLDCALWVEVFPLSIALECNVARANPECGVYQQESSDSVRRVSQLYHLQSSCRGDWLSRTLEEMV